MKNVLNNNDKNRKRNADIYKALSMIMVIIGHVPVCPNTVRKLVYSFHMPAFFFIYGVLYTIEVHAQRKFLTKSFFIKKIKRLIIPCYIWAIIYTICSGSLNLKNLLIILIGNQKCFIKANSLSSLWFLPCMFVSVIVFEIIASYLAKKEINTNKILTLTVILFCMACLSAMLPKLNHGYLWSIDVIPMSLLFIFIGYCIHPYLIKLERFGFIIKSSLFFIFLALCYFINSFNLRFVSINNVDMASRNYGNCILYICAAIAGCTVLVIISNFIDQAGNKFMKYIAHKLSYIGKHTLILLVLHKPLTVWLSNLFSSVNLNNFVVTAISTTVTLVLITICIKPLSQYCPYFFGEK